MLAPKGFSQTIDKRAFVDAKLAASKRVGVLRLTLSALMITAFLAIGAISVLFGNDRTVAALIGGIAVACLAVVLASAFLKIIPDAVKESAERDFVSYDNLMNGADVAFTADDMTFRSSVMVRRVEYAKTTICIERAARFVLLTDDRTVVILEKSCFSQPQETVAFLRDVYARRYVDQTKQGGAAT